MLNREIDLSIGYDRIPASRWQTFDVCKQNAFAPKDDGFLDAVPVMPATVLGLDMVLQEPSVDLQMASELILSDVGATIRILRLIGKEYEIAAERPSRMCECIASLDVDTWFGAISAGAFVGDWEHSAMSAVWKHCRLIAQYAQLVAASLDDIYPDDAYLVGLLHGILAIPASLGCGRGGEEKIALSTMEETLPVFVIAAMRSMSESASPSVWRFILTAAHKLAESKMNSGVSEFCDTNRIPIG